jgi:hypothetical protein
MKTESLIKRLIFTFVAFGLMYWLHAALQAAYNPFETAAALSQARDVATPMGSPTIISRLSLPDVACFALFAVILFLIWIVPWTKPNTNGDR